MTQLGVIHDSPRTHTNQGLYGLGTYKLPIHVCATCGQPTDKAMHPDCARKGGRLVVKLEAQGVAR